MFTLQNLLDAGLPAVSTDGNDADAVTQFSRTLTLAEWLTYLSIADPERGNFLSNQQEIRNDAETAIASLQTFIDNGSPTNAQVIAAVKLLARVSIRMIRILLRLIRFVT